MLAHELRNPLAPIRNASEILARKLADDPQMKKTVSLVKRQVTHLARLVDDLLDVSRITEGRIELRRAPQELAPILAQARESVEPLMREKQHVFSVSTSFEPLYVHGDHARLVQSVANVLTNAAKYTDPGGEIRLELRRQNDRAVDRGIRYRCRDLSRAAAPGIRSVRAGRPITRPIAGRSGHRTVGGQAADRDASGKCHRVQ